MSDPCVIHPMPRAGIEERGYNPVMFAKRVQHRHLGISGRLSGEVRWDRGYTWFEVETNSGRYWWATGNLIFLGPVAMPCPRGTRA